MFYALLQCNMDIMSLNHYIMYVAETINYHYVLFSIFKDLTIWNAYIMSLNPFLKT
jgi:hypothetical protein